MFYTKSKLPGDRTVKTEITDENVFTRCPECGRELPVDLAEVFGDGEGDLFSTNIVCSRCTAKRPDEKVKVAEGVKVPLTYDGIVWLEHILSRSGYGEEIQNLFDIFLVDSLEDLSPDEYSAFGNALAKMAIGVPLNEPPVKERNDG